MRIQLALAALGGLVVIGLGLSALATAEVVARGQLVPSGGPGVRRIRVWGAVEFYISSETARPELDTLTVISFALLAGAMGVSALVLLVGRVRDHLTTFFVLAAVGAAYLAADELLAIHESTGHNLQFLRGIPGVERPDDVVLMMYAIPVGIFAWVFRDVLTSVRAAVWPLSGAVGIAVLAEISDLLAVAAIEERAELVTALLISCGLIVLAAVRVPNAVVSSALETFGTAPGHRRDPAA